MCTSTLSRGTAALEAPAAPLFPPPKTPQPPSRCTNLLLPSLTSPPSFSRPFRSNISKELDDLHELSTGKRWNFLCNWSYQRNSVVFQPLVSMYIKRKCRGPDGGRVKKLFRSWFSNLNGGPRVWVRLSQGQASTCAVLCPSEAYYRVIRTWRRLCIVRIIRRTLFVNTYTVRLAEINVRVGSYMNRIIDRQTDDEQKGEFWKMKMIDSTDRFCAGFNSARRRGPGDETRASAIISDRSIDKHYCDVSGGDDAIFLLFHASWLRVYSLVTVERVSLASNCWWNYSVKTAERKKYYRQH